MRSGSVQAVPKEIAAHRSSGGRSGRLRLFLSRLRWPTPACRACASTQPPGQLQDRSLDSRVLGARSFSRPYDQVESCGQSMTIFAKCFADQSLPVISNDGVANLATDRKPQTAWAIAVFASGNDQRAVGRVRIACIYGFEFRLLSQAGGSGKGFLVSVIRIPALRLAHV